MNNKICAVVLTYNRKKLLLECLQSLVNQSYKLDQIIIIDNNSTDGTRAYIEDKGYILNDIYTDNKKKLISKIPIKDALININYHYVQKNIGASAGFSLGIKIAFENNLDWAWIMDDDTVPNLDSLEKMVDSKHFKEADRTGYLCNLVKWTDGNIHQMNLPNTIGHEWLNDLLIEKSVQVSSSSFVGVLFNKNAIKKVGLPIKDFYIWYDDIEFTSRVSKDFDCFLILDSIVTHKTKSNESPKTLTLDNTNFEKFKYGFRNEIILTRILEKSFFKKAFKILQIINSKFSLFFKKKIPFLLLWWTLKGLFFRIKIDYLEE
jgi:GT2 family glycosyltransferase